MFNFKSIAAPPCAVPLSSSFRVVDLNELKIETDSDISTAVSFYFESAPNDISVSKPPADSVESADNTAPNTRDLNYLYAQWSSAKPAEKNSYLELLLAGVRDYSQHVIWKEFSNLRNDVDDIAQSISIKVWNKIGAFTNASKFTTWVYEIIRSTALDSYRARKREQKVIYKDGEIHEGIEPTKSNQDDFNPDDDISGGEYISKQAKNATESEWVTDLDIQSSINRLPAADLRLVELVRQGYDGNELGKLFNCSAKKIYNRYSRIIKGLECEVVAYSVLLHTCKPSFEISYELQPNGRFISDGKKPASYRALPERCKCRKEITRAESLKLKESGTVGLVFKLKNGKIAVDEKQVWAERAVRVPRIAATNVSAEKYASGDRTSRRNLDIAQDLSILMLRGLMHGPTETVRHPVTGKMVEIPTAQPVDESKDVWKGKPMLVVWADQRTPYSHEQKKFEPKPSPNKPTEYFPIVVPEGRISCPKCQKGSLLVSNTASGVVRHECDSTGSSFACTYLQVWQPKK